MLVPLTMQAIGTCDRELKPAFERALQLPEVKKLWEVINSEGEVRVLAVQGKEEHFKAYWEGVQRIICVNLGLKPSLGEQISSLLFEMHNAVNDHKALTIYSKASKGKISQETFAREMERMEYENSLNACNLLDKGVKMGLYPQDCYLKRFDSFEEFLDVQKMHGHYDHYLRTYHQIQGVNFS